jgi:hypothetical protein
MVDGKKEPVRLLPRHEEQHAQQRAGGQVEAGLRGVRGRLDEGRV